MITPLEEVTLNAWPALQTMHADGWILRFANGYTKRANSVNPLYPSPKEAAAKVQFCERTYRARNLPVVFKMTSAAQPENLDGLLAERGYRVDSPTSVQTMELASLDTPSASDAELNSTLTDEWIDAFCRLSETSEQRKPTLRQMLLNIIPLKSFAAVRRADEIVACGLGVCQGDYIGFFDIVTAKPYRNQGIGKRLMQGLLAWGNQSGARHAYLQVMLDNPPALHLYDQLGFKQVYHYWYRINS
jgi:N-acetylglutamate synthase